MRDSKQDPVRIRIHTYGLVILDVDVKTLALNYLLTHPIKKGLPIFIETTMPCVNTIQHDVIGDEEEDV